MKILITGAAGMLGRTLRKQLSAEHELILTDVSSDASMLTMDITDSLITERIITETQPDVVLHCAAMTAVDRCETEQELAYLLNQKGTSNVAKACSKVSARLIAFSTDYVFSGEEGLYTEDSTPNPQTIYGKSKLAGEMEALTYCDNTLIARLAWLYGQGGPSFVHTMIKLGKESGSAVRVVNDQRGNPTSAMSVAAMIDRILKRAELRGIVHITCEGNATWYEFACAIFSLWGFNRAIEPCTTSEYPRPAKRPSDSRLLKKRLAEWGLPLMPDWRDALTKFYNSGERLP